MKKILIALFIGFSAFINAQNKISGKITDKNNNPIKGVNIFVSELHKSSETDEKGTYSINNVPNGTIKITYTLLGFTSQNKTLLLQNGENKLDIVLEPTLFQMDEVIVATSFQKLQSQNENYFFGIQTLIFNYGHRIIFFHKISILFKNGQK